MRQKLITYTVDIPDDESTFFETLLDNLDQVVGWEQHEEDN